MKCQVSQRQQKKQLHDCHAALEPSSIDLPLAFAFDHSLAFALAALAALHHTLALLCLCFCMGCTMNLATFVVGAETSRGACLSSE